ncbi:MAG: HPr family phosphocarrier protein [Candidatus Omnitrophica bacterium]|nr:HPr family phosphocarrier protein [Candidatus Omnitrophota bacterium]
MKYFHKIISSVILVAFFFTSILPPARAQEMPWMPVPGMAVALTPTFTPAYLKGMVIHPNDPFKFDFIIYRGDKNLGKDDKQDEYSKLIKYFLAALAVPDTDQWVNLSPYEKNRIIPDSFGLTEMGRDLLAQDYLLKQITASLMSPNTELGKKFWASVYEKAYEKFGKMDIPMDIFNKVWIVPDKAVIYEKDNTVYVLESHLKVMTEEDYEALKMSAESRATARDLAAQKTVGAGFPRPDDKGRGDRAPTQIIKEIIIPALEKEVNTGKNFAPLRQVYSGMLLATWYKRSLKESILGKIYADKVKVKGVDQDPKTNQQIYEQYVAAYKKGVFNMIKEDYDALSKQIIPHKYFSGGTEGYVNVKFDHAMISRDQIQQGKKNNDIVGVSLVKIEEFLKKSPLASVTNRSLKIAQQRMQQIKQRMWVSKLFSSQLHTLQKRTSRSILWDSILKRAVIRVADSSRTKAEAFAAIDMILGLIDSKHAWNSELIKFFNEITGSSRQSNNIRKRTVQAEPESTADLQIAIYDLFFEIQSILKSVEEKNWPFVFHYGEQVIKYLEPSSQDNQALVSLKHTFNPQAYTRELGLDSNELNEFINNGKIVDLIQAVKEISRAWSQADDERNQVLYKYLPRVIRVESILNTIVEAFQGKRDMRVDFEVYREGRALSTVSLLDIEDAVNRSQNLVKGDRAMVTQKSMEENKTRLLSYQVEQLIVKKETTDVVLTNSGYYKMEIALRSKLDGKVVKFDEENFKEDFDLKILKQTTDFGAWAGPETAGNNPRRLILAMTIDSKNVGHDLKKARSILEIVAKNMKKYLYVTDQAMTTADAKKNIGNTIQKFIDLVHPGTFYNDREDLRPHRQLESMLTALKIPVQAAQTKADWGAIVKTLESDWDTTFNLIDNLSHESLKGPEQFDYFRKKALKVELKKMFRNLNTLIRQSANQAMSVDLNYALDAEERPAFESWTKDYQEGRMTQPNFIKLLEGLKLTKEEIKSIVADLDKAKAGDHAMTVEKIQAAIPVAVRTHTGKFSFIYQSEYYGNLELLADKMLENAKQHNLMAISTFNGYIIYADANSTKGDIVNQYKEQILAGGLLTSRTAPGFYTDSEHQGITTDSNLRRLSLANRDVPYLGVVDSKPSVYLDGKKIDYTGKMAVVEDIEMEKARNVELYGLNMSVDSWIFAVNSIWKKISESNFKFWPIDLYYQHGGVGSYGVGPVAYLMVKAVKGFRIKVARYKSDDLVFLDADAVELRRSLGTVFASEKVKKDKKAELLKWLVQTSEELVKRNSFFENKLQPLAKDQAMITKDKGKNNLTELKRQLFETQVSFGKLAIKFQDQLTNQQGNYEWPILNRAENAIKEDMNKTRDRIESLQKEIRRARRADHPIATKSNEKNQTKLTELQQLTKAQILFGKLTMRLQDQLTIQQGNYEWPILNRVEKAIREKMRQTRRTIDALQKRIPKEQQTDSAMATKGKEKNQDSLTELQQQLTEEQISFGKLAIKLQDQLTYQKSNYEWPISDRVEKAIKEDMNKTRDRIESIQKEIRRVRRTERPMATKSNEKNQTKLTELQQLIKAQILFGKLTMRLQDQLTYQKSNYEWPISDRVEKAIREKMNIARDRIESLQKKIRQARSTDRAMTSETLLPLQEIEQIESDATRQFPKKAVVVDIPEEPGIHARLAAQIVDVANRVLEKLKIELLINPFNKHRGFLVSARSILNIELSEIENGQTVELYAKDNGNNKKETIDAVFNILERLLHDVRIIHTNIHEYVNEVDKLAENIDQAMTAKNIISTLPAAVKNHKGAVVILRKEYGAADMRGEVANMFLERDQWPKADNVIVLTSFNGVLLYVSKDTKDIDSVLTTQWSSALEKMKKNPISFSVLAQDPTESKSTYKKHLVDRSEEFGGSPVVVGAIDQKLVVMTKETIAAMKAEANIQNIRALIPQAVRNHQDHIMIVSDTTVNLDNLLRNMMREQKNSPDENVLVLASFNGSLLYATKGMKESELMNQVREWWSRNGHFVTLGQLPGQPDREYLDALIRESKKYERSPVAGSINKQLRIFVNGTEMDQAMTAADDDFDSFLRANRMRMETNETREITVNNVLGIHMKPSRAIYRAAEAFAKQGVFVTIETEDDIVRIYDESEPSLIMSIQSLGIQDEQPIKVTIDSQKKLSPETINFVFDKLTYLLQTKALLENPEWDTNNATKIYLEEIAQFFKSQDKAMTSKEAEAIVEQLVKLGQDQARDRNARMDEALKIIARQEKIDHFKVVEMYHLLYPHGASGLDFALSRFLDDWEDPAEKRERNKPATLTDKRAEEIVEGLVKLAHGNALDRSEREKGIFKLLGPLVPKDFPKLYETFISRYPKGAGGDFDIGRYILDQAMSTRTINPKISDVGLTPDTKGGIDFNSSNLDMQIKRDGKGVVLPVSQQNLESIHINGLMPVILDIKPGVSLPIFQ